MNSIEYIGKIIKKYGTPIALSAAGNPLNGRELRAFIQPLRYKNKMYLFGTFTPAGYVDESYYLYVGPSDTDICSLPDSATIIMDGEKFYFTRRERVRLSQTTVYYWAVLRALIEEE